MMKNAGTTMMDHTHGWTEVDYGTLKNAYALFLAIEEEIMRLS